MELEANLKINLGKLIATKRIESNITQEDLSNGICSIPYLSKIENNKIEANPEIISLLCDKLRINFDDILLMHTKFKKLLTDIYIAINNKESSIVYSLWNNLNELKNNILDSDLINSYYLISFRYYLFISNLDLARNVEKKINKLKKTFTKQHYFQYYYFKGLYFSLNQNYLEGITNFLKAKNLQVEIQNKDINLTCHLALTYSQNFNSPLAIQYGLEALDNFQNELNLKRIAECHTILGINLTRVGDFDKALNHYNKVLKVASTYNDHKIFSKTLHNIGYMYSIKKDSTRAIEHYQRSLEYKKVEEPMYVNTVYYLALELIRNKESRKALEWIEKGIDISKNNEEKKTYFLKLTLLKFLELSDINSCIEFAENECVPFFKEKNNNHDLVDCYVTIGDLYHKLCKYKNSSNFYKLAINHMK